MLSLKISIILCRDSGTLSLHNMMLMFMLWFDATSLPSSRSGSIFADDSSWKVYNIYYIHPNTYNPKKKKRPNGCVRAPWFANHVECQWQPTPFALLFYYFSMKFHWLHFSSSLWVSVNSEKKVVSMFSYFCVGSAGQNKRLHRLLFHFFLLLCQAQRITAWWEERKRKWDLRKKITSSPPFLCKLGTDTQSWMEIIIHAGNFTPCHVTHCRLTLTEFLNISIMSNNIILIISFSMD